MEAKKNRQREEVCRGFFFFCTSGRYAQQRHRQTVCFLL